MHELKHHRLTDIITMGISFIWTKLFFRKADLIRRPFYLRGDKKKLKLNQGFITGRGCRIELFDNGVIKLGKNCHIGDYVHIVSSNYVEVGDNALFASKIFISDTSHGSYGADGDCPNVPPNDRELISSFVKIGKNVWLGDNVVVLPGVTIGDGCVVGANAVVSRDITPNTIAGGIPAKPLKRWNSEMKQWIRV